YPGLRGLALGYTLPPTAWACDVAVCVPRASRTRPGLHAAAHCVGLRRSCVEVLVVRRTRASRTRPGLHAAAHCVGLRRCGLRTQGFADSPWATRCRPLRGLATLRFAYPGLRGLALGYTLPPTAWACLASRFAYPGLRRPALGYPL